MADNTNKVTIDAAYFNHLFARAAERERLWSDREGLILECGKIANERDELKAALERANQTNSSQADQLRDALNALEQERMNKCDEVTAKSLAAAERCIDTIRGFHWETFEEIENLSQNIMAVILSYDKAREAAR